MKATLLYLVLDIAAVLLTHIAQNLTEYPLQRIVSHHSARRAIGVFHRLVTVIADIERRTVKMTRLFGSIAITATQLGYIFLRTQYTGNNQSMKGHTLYMKTVEKS